jgi:hypothetical protein
MVIETVPRTDLDGDEEASAGLVYLMEEVESRFFDLHKVHFPQVSEAAA